MIFGETNWEIDFRKELRKYERMEKSDEFDDSRFYRKNKESILLKTA